MSEHSADWFESQYNNRRRVPEAEVLLQRWAEASALVREQARCQLDLRYGAGPRQRLDVFSDSVAKAPVLVFIHGGYWRALSKEDLSFVAPGFTSEGAVVVIPGYDLCPEVSMERIPLQLAEALAWVWRHVADYGGDPNHIVLAGHSAGGHLAALLSCFDWKSLAPDLPRQLVKGVLSLSGLHELEPLVHTPFLQADLRLDEASARRLSPVHQAPPDSPLYAVVGGAESEEFKRQCRLIQEAWGPQAVPVVEEVPGYNHFDLLYDLVAPEGISHALARRLLDLRWYSPLL
ncbi:alpha/beta hydrolase [Pelomonas sp. BJYL3]|uniref:alpha/beta hydrolase n=1 Tax=Pelomonas sp. BJYL3 TaxID=2976697 RepID=UPI0022B3B78B|nr:alpha/beta hydrolase [Pelomonas sp. BJYL3]